MLKIDKEMIEQLQGDIDINKEEVFNFSNHIVTLYKEGNILDLQKLLGAFYSPIVGSMFGDVEVDTQALEVFGFKSPVSEKTIKHLIKIAILFYKEEELKEYGDQKVTEAMVMCSVLHGLVHLSSTVQELLRFVMEQYRINKFKE